MNGRIVSLRRPAAQPRFHTLDCACRDCRRPSPADAPLSANGIAWRCLAGFAIGLLLVTVIDKIIGGPGVLAMWGLG